MRIFVLDKYTGLCLCLLCALLLVVPILWYTAEPVDAEQAVVPVCTVPTEEPVVAVTFNLHGDGKDIPSLLSALKAHQCTAAFFATKQWASAHSSIIREIADAGHTVAALADTSSKANESVWISSINEAEAVIAEITGLSPGFSRCKDLQSSSRFAAACHQSGRVPIAWSVDSLDWRDFSCEQIAFRLAAHMEKGAILRFQTGTPAIANFSDILAAIRSAGYTTAPLQTLFSASISSPENFSAQNIKKHLTNLQFCAIILQDDLGV